MDDRLPWRGLLAGALFYAVVLWLAHGLSPAPYVGGFIYNYYFLSLIDGQLDIPLHNVRASMVRSHDDVMPVVVPDGPKPDEIVFALVMSTGPRIHARIGGLSLDQITGENGLT